MKKLIIALVLATFLFSMPVFGAERERALNDEEMQEAATTTGPFLSLQSIGIGRRRTVRRTRRRIRRRTIRRARRRIRRSNRRRYGRIGLPTRGGIGVRTRRRY
jgi:hypothetical protein